MRHNFLRAASLLMAMGVLESAIAGDPLPVNGNSVSDPAVPLLINIDSTNSAYFCREQLLGIEAVGRGTNSLLGKFAAVHQGALNFATIDTNTGCGPNPGSVTLTTAIGDSLILSLGGDHCNSAPGAPLGLTSDSFTVASGTGRFAGATGAGTYRDVNTSENPDFTGTTA